MACETDYVDCEGKNLTFEELFKLLVARLPNGDPALRTCGDSSASSGLKVQHFIATANQTTFTLDNPIEGDVAWGRNGALKHNDPNSAVLGQNDVVLDAQTLGTEITFIY